MPDFELYVRIHRNYSFYFIHVFASQYSHDETEQSFSAPSVPLI